MKRARQHWPLLTGLSLLWSLTVFLLVVSLRQNDGHLVYGVDDAYIHMAMAKNMALYGTWGVTRDAFSSSSSSPLWTVILTLCFRLVGVHDAVPFLLNVILSSALLVVLYRLLRFYGLPPTGLVLVLALVTLVVPLPTLVFLGMEFVLAGLLAVAAVFQVPRVLTTGDDRHSFRALLCLAPLLAATRYEMLFLLGAMCLLLLLLGRQVRRSFIFILGAVAALPVVVYGLVSLRQGWPFFPVSVLLKANLPAIPAPLSLRSMESLIDAGFVNQLFATPALLWLAALTALLLIVHYGGSTRLSELVIPAWVLLLTLVTHMQFARPALRYTAYLMLIGLTLLSLAAWRLWPERWTLQWRREKIGLYLAAAFLALLIAYPFALRSLRSLAATPTATTNIYQQQYQMGLFLARFYGGQTVAVNDIGAVSYLADARVLDVWGLGSLEVARRKLDPRSAQGDLRALAIRHGVTIAVLYDLGGLPGQWVKVGEWTIPNNVVCFHPTVSFFAVAPSEVETLTEYLKAYSSHLPPAVRQTGRYTR